MLTIKDFKINTIELQKFGGELARPKNLAILAASFGFGFFAYKTLQIYLVRRKYSHIPGPKTKGILGFYYGNLLDIAEAKKNEQVMVDLFVKWHELYGDVFKFQVGNFIFVVTSDQNAIKESLIVKDFPKPELTIDRIGYPFGARFLGVGLVTELNYERWKHRRAIFNPGFHRHVLITFVNHFNQIVNNLSEKFRAKADGKTVVHLMNELNRATLDAIALDLFSQQKIAFGMHTESISVKDSTLNIYLTKIFYILQESFLDPFMQYKPNKFGKISELRSMVDYIRKLGKDKIVERITAFKNNEHMPDDILSSILASYKSDEELDVEAMTDDFITFFVAGQETTANTLAFCFLELGRHPEIVKKAREEIDRVLGERTEVTFQDFNDLKYCHAIFKEALRLYPPAAALTRCTNEKMNICKYEIPKNTLINFSTYMNARLEKYFKNACEFRPERFLKTEEANNAGLENYVYLPFSLGPRNCIGQNFAQLEGVIVIAKLLQKFDFKLDPNQSFSIVQALTLRPKDGTKIFITMRSTS